MNWVEIVWSMIGAACLTLAAIHFFIGIKQRNQGASLIFSSAAISVAIIAFFELAIMSSRTTQQYAELLKWVHVPVAFLILFLVCFVRIQFSAGNKVLAYAAVITRFACLIPNFTTGENLNFISIGHVQTLTTWGATIGIPKDTVTNPWMMLGSVNMVLVVAFFVSVIMDLRRRPGSPQRTRNLYVCAAIVGFAVFAWIWTVAVVREIIQAPLMFTPAFLGVLVAMGYELGTDILRASQLAVDLSVTEDHLRDSEKRMDLAVHAAGIGLWNWDMATGSAWFSTHVRKLLGGDAGRPVALDEFLDLIHPTDRSAFDEAIHGGPHGVGEFRCEYRIASGAARTRWLACRGQVISDLDGPKRIDGVLVDITDRKEAEDRFRLVVESAPAAMLLVDPSGKIQLANAQTERMFGYGEQELVGGDINDLVPRRFRRNEQKAPARLVSAAIAGDAGGGHGLIGLRQDGVEIHLHMNFSPIPIEYDLLVLVSIADLSDRISMERDAAIQRDELAHLSRVAMLAELSGSIAHELNQPLTAILSNAQAGLRYLANTPPDLMEVHVSLSSIVESDKRAGEVIRRLRALLKKDQADHKLLDMNDLIHEVTRIIGSDLMHRNVEVTFDLNQDLPLVIGDRVQLQQVLLNLIMNASDAMSDISRPKQIILKTRKFDDGQVEVAVSDVGMGIPQEDLGKIFVPFVTSKPDGLGLGLAVCMTIIKAHAGQLLACNNTGIGATVSFRLPIPH